MEWLTQNWIWLLLLVGVVFMMRRGGMGCGHMGGHSRHGVQTPPESEPGSRADTAALTDPVSGQAVDPGRAVSSAHRGRIYYFASRENRDRFEQAPERYAAGGAGAQPEGHAHHRHGC